ncbi:MAG: DMT family transporter [Proteobacteria bacterium]|nr:DMT family transporter [Pseudomonadota bacterium]
MINWFVLTLISSVALSLRELSVKKAGSGLSSAYMSWGLNFFMFLMILGITLLFGRTVSVSGEFLKILVLAAIMDAAATLLYLSAIKHGDLSKTIPMLCFIPVVQLFVTPVLVHENLSFPGMAGVLVVVAGSYILNIQQWDGFFSPIKGLVQNKSTLMMLATACIWGVSSSFHKIGIRQTNPLFWGACEIGLISVFLFPIAMKSEKKFFSVHKIKKTIWPALFSTFSVLSYYMAINLGPVAYVSSVRRMAVLFSVVIGVVVLKEKARTTGLLGGLIMILGSVIICLFG